MLDLEWAARVGYKNLYKEKTYKAEDTINNQKKTR